MYTKQNIENKSIFDHAILVIKRVSQIHIHMQTKAYRSTM